MAVHLIAVGLDQHTAALSLRERCVLGPTELPALAAPELPEVAVLCTCNRTEVYAAAPDPAVAVARICAYLARRAGTTPEQLRPHLYSHVGPADVLRHLCRVATGLESLVRGETQVLGQVKEAYLRSAEAGTVGKYLHALFHQALACAKRVHAETGLGTSPVSVGAAAVDFARQALGDLDGRSAVLLGAGETAETVARRLREAGFGRIDVVNRTASRAADLASRVGGAARDVAELEDRLADADVLITSTASPTPVVSAELVRGVVARRRGRPLLVVDIAVPRDVEPVVGTIPGVRLCNVDDLEGVAATGRREREREAGAAEAIIEGTLACLQDWLQSQGAVPVIRALTQRLESVAAAEADRMLRRLGALEPRERELVRQLAFSVARKLLDEPVRRLRDLAGTPGGHDAVRAFAEAFGLEVPELSVLPGTGGTGTALRAEGRAAPD